MAEKKSRKKSIAKLRNILHLVSRLSLLYVGSSLISLLENIVKTTYSAVPIAVFSEYSCSRPFHSISYFSVFMGE